MPIKKEKINRKIESIKEGTTVFDMPPDWTFQIDCIHHGPQSFDFNIYREHGREQLAMHFRNAVWHMRHSLISYTLKSYVYGGMTPFWNFLEDMRKNGVLIRRLEEIDKKIIEQFIAWLELRMVSYGSKKKGQPQSIASNLIAYRSLKSILLQCTKLYPNNINPKLEFPTVAFANKAQLIPKKLPYSKQEQLVITTALKNDLEQIHGSTKPKLTHVRTLVAHLLILGMATGKNLQSLLELERDSLQPHALPDQEFLLTHKRRGYRSHALTVKTEATPGTTQHLSPIPVNVADHYRYLCEFTKELAEAASEPLKSFVFLFKCTQQKRKNQITRLIANDVQNLLADFVERHHLKDDSDNPLKLQFSRFRPTMASELYRQTRDIHVVQRALGHKYPATTFRHYIESPLESERDHRLVLDAMTEQFRKIEIGGKIALAADGKIPTQSINNLLSGGYNTGIARCSNPFRENGVVCQKYLACFRCPNMCVFEDDLWRLFSFYYRLLDEQPKINPHHWLKTYGPIVRRIDTDIALKFPLEIVEVARDKARINPHPTWRKSNL